MPPPQKGDPTLPDNYRPIALKNTFLKLWTCLIKDEGSTYAETCGIFSDQEDGFRLLCSIHDALASIIMMMEEAEISTSCARTLMALSTPPTTVSCSNICANSVCPSFVDTCEKLYGVSTIDYDTSYAPTPSIDINRIIQQEDTPSPFLFTLFLEPFRR
jgi:hypothetical protein